MHFDVEQNIVAGSTPSLKNPFGLHFYKVWLKINSHMAVTLGTNKASLVQRGATHAVPDMGSK